LPAQVFEGSYRFRKRFSVVVWKRERERERRREIGRAIYSPWRHVQTEIRRKWKICDVWEIGVPSHEVKMRWYTSVSLCQ